MSLLSLTADADFSALDVVLKALPGTNRTCFTIQVYEDSAVEDTESFAIFISIIQTSGSSQIKILNDRANYNILDEDSECGAPWMLAFC